MRWFRIRKANIDPELRKTFEQHGAGTMQTLLAVGDFFRHKGERLLVRDSEGPLLSWLTEQYDRVERKETWSLTMEAAITIFVAAELLLSVCRRS
jgi:hypothetical protein